MLWRVKIWLDGPVVLAGLLELPHISFRVFHSVTVMSRECHIVCYKISFFYKHLCYVWTLLFVLYILLTLTMRTNKTVCFYKFVYWTATNYKSLYEFYKYKNQIYTIIYVFVYIGLHIYININIYINNSNDKGNVTALFKLSYKNWVIYGLCLIIRWYWKYLVPRWIQHKCLWGKGIFFWWQTQCS